MRASAVLVVDMRPCVACTLPGIVFVFVVMVRLVDVRMLPNLVLHTYFLVRVLQGHQPNRLSHPFPFQRVDRYPLGKGFPPMAGTMDIVAVVVVGVVDDVLGNLPVGPLPLV